MPRKDVRFGDDEKKELGRDVNAIFDQTKDDEKTKLRREVSMIHDYAMLGPRVQTR